MTLRPALAAIFIAVLAFAPSSSVTAEGRREASAHQHGSGRLAVAVDGRRVEFEFEVPASDILGFEHAPSTPAETATADAAKATLAQFSNLAALPPEAGCTQVSAAVELPGPSSGGHADHAHGANHAHDGDHAEVHAVYSFDCTAPERIGTVAFSYFTRFERAERLDAMLLGPKGQTAAELTRASPSLALGGLF